MSASHTNLVFINRSTLSSRSMGSVHEPPVLKLEPGLKNGTLHLGASLEGTVDCTAEEAEMNVTDLYADLSRAWDTHLSINNLTGSGTAWHLTAFVARGDTIQPEMLWKTESGHTFRVEVEVRVDKDTARAA